VAGSGVVEITQGQPQLAELLRENKLVVVDHWSKNCESCKGLLPTIENLAALYPRVIFAKLDAELPGNLGYVAAHKNESYPWRHLYVHDVSGELLGAVAGSTVDPPDGPVKEPRSSTGPPVDPPDGPVKERWKYGLTLWKRSLGIAIAILVSSPLWLAIACTQRSRP
jgi:thiol-disulfide isomerase/thioredoxin